MTSDPRIPAHEPPALTRVDASTQDREITLGAGTILGIFFALAIGGAIVFFMGYTLGRRSAQNSAALQNTTPGAAINFPAGAKPSANSAAAPSTPADASTATASTPTPDVATVTIAAQPVASTQPAAPIVSAPLDVQPTPAGLTNVVQIAAVSRQDDANVLLSALRKKGYMVVARSVPGDNLIHIQVGPYSTRAEADDMRQRLIADGYNAIVK
jgi:cell division septation protein DedD